jgi:hypothetical protein
VTAKLPVLNKHGEPEALNGWVRYFVRAEGLTGEPLDHGQKRGRQRYCLPLFIASMVLSGSVLVAFGAVNGCATSAKVGNRA